MSRLDSARTPQITEAGAGDIRARLILAAMTSGASLATNVQVQLAEALSHPSIRDTAVRSLEMLWSNEAALDDVLRARLVECAEIVVGNGWRWRANDEIAVLAEAQRAKLREAEAARNVERV